MKLKKKTINLLTVCGSCAVILGMGIGGVAYSVLNKPANTPAPDNIYEMQEDDYQYNGSSFESFSDGVLDRIKSLGYNGIEFPAEEEITQIRIKSNIWEGHNDFIKTVEIPKNINECRAYEGSNSYCLFPDSITKLIIDGSGITLQFGDSGLDKPSIFHNATMLDTIIFPNVASFGNINVSSAKDTEGFSQCGINTHKKCRIVCPKLDEETRNMVWQALTLVCHLPDKWEVVDSL